MTLIAKQVRAPQTRGTQATRSGGRETGIELPPETPTPRLQWGPASTFHLYHTFWELEFRFFDLTP